MRKFALAGFIVGGLSLYGSTALAQIVCTPMVPVDGDTVTCSGTANSQFFELEADDLTVDLTGAIRAHSASSGTGFSLTGANNRVTIGNEVLVFFNQPFDGTYTNFPAISPDTVSGDDIFENFGTVPVFAIIYMGIGNDRFINQEGAYFGGSLTHHGGGGLTFENYGDVGVSNFISDGIYLGSGDDQILNYSDFESGNDSILLEGGDDYLLNAAGGIIRSFSGVINFGEGNDSAEIQAASLVESSITFEFGTGNDEFLMTGGDFQGDVDFGDGDDSAMLLAGTLTGVMFTSSGGNNTFTLEDASYSGGLALGTGNDTVNFEGGIFTPDSEITLGDGDDTLNFNGTNIAEGSQFRLNAGDDTVVINSTVIDILINTDDGDDTITLSATSSIDAMSEIHSGAGNDAFFVEAGSTFNALLNAGSNLGGNDTLLSELNVTDLSRFEEFEVITVDGDGVARIDEFMSAEMGALEVLSGQLNVEGELFLEQLSFNPATTLLGTGTVTGTSLNDEIWTLTNTIRPGTLLTEATGGGLANILTLENADVVLGSASRLEIDFLNTDDLTFNAGVTENAISTMLEVTNGALSVNGGMLIISDIGTSPIIGEADLILATATDGVSGAFGDVQLSGKL